MAETTKVEKKETVYVCLLSENYREAGWGLIDQSPPGAKDRQSKREARWGLAAWTPSGLKVLA